MKFSGAIILLSLGCLVTLLVQQREPQFLEGMLIGAMLTWIAVLATIMYTMKEE